MAFDLSSDGGPDFIAEETEDMLKRWGVRQKKIDYLFSVTWSKTMCGMRNYLSIFYFESKDDLKCAHVFIFTNLRLY